MPDRDYSGTPLHRKLGIGEGSAVALLDAPEEFPGLLGPLPDGVELRRRAGGPVDVVVLFATSRARLARRFPAAAGAIAADGGVWVAWPKKASGVATDLDFDFVQRVGLEAGLVDNKTAAIDGTWTSVRFVVRLADRAGWRGAAPRSGGAG
jgi:hypothetical protein